MTSSTGGSMSSTDIALRIICIGNMLHGNDGLGHTVFETLSRSDLPHNVELLDGGIGGMALLPWFRNTPRVLLVDLMKSECKTGQIQFFANVTDELPVVYDQTGAHGGDITTLLSMLPVYLSTAPQVDLMAVSAPSLDYFNKQLDASVKNAVERVCKRILHYIEQM